MSHPPERAPLAWPVAAGAVLVLVVALIGLGALLTRSDSSPAPDQPSQAVGTPRPTPLAAALATPAATNVSGPTSAAVEDKPGGNRPAAPALATTPETKVALVGTFAAIQPTPTPSGWWNDERRFDDQALSNEVLLAYNQFWQVRAQALYELDASSLSRVMAGNLLEAERRTIDDLRAQNLAQHVDVDHNARVLHVTEDEAAIEDKYLSRTVMVDASSKEPLESPPSVPWTLAYRLRKIDGAWKVVDSVRVRYAQP
jgi:hypothetical protein